MERVFSKVEELADNAKEYVNTRIESLKLNAVEKSSVIIANGVARIVVAIVFIFFIALASIALSLVLGEWLGKIWAGFLVVACFYLLLGIIIWFARGKLIRVPVMNALIQQLFKHDEEI
jgi:Putative Actinobacterial Holin-X, holin superfamily III